MSRRVIGGTIVLLSIVGGLGLWMRRREGAEAVYPVPGSVERVTLEVLNGSGVDGLAAETTRLLRREGYDVVFYGTAAADTHAVTRILVRRGDTTAVRGVRAVLGMGVLTLEPDPLLLLDATVILGRDFASRDVRP